MSTSFLPFSTGGCFDHDIFPTTLHAKLRTLLTRVAVLVQASILYSQKNKSFLLHLPSELASYGGKKSRTKPSERN